MMAMFAQPLMPALQAMLPRSLRQHQALASMLPQAYVAKHSKQIHITQTRVPLHLLPTRFLMLKGGVLHNPALVLCGRQDQSLSLWDQGLQQGCARVYLSGADPSGILHLLEAMQSACAAEQATD